MYIYINHIASILYAPFVRAWRSCANRSWLIRVTTVLLILSMQVPSFAAATVSLAGLAGDHELTVVQNEGHLQVILSHTERSMQKSGSHGHNQIETLFISKRENPKDHPDHYLSFAQFDSLAPKAETDTAHQKIKDTAIADLYLYALADETIATQFMWPTSRDNLHRPLQPCQNMQGIVMRL